MKTCRLSPLGLAIHAGCLALLASVPALAQDAPSSAAPATDAVQLDRIIVTASKREQSVRDVAGSVAAVTGQQLEELNAQGLGDYIQKTPGVVFNNYEPGMSHVVVRGIATNSGNVQGQPTTGYFLNEVPLMEPGWTIAVPDIDAFDLSRVEVLRGPQGSLFGSASMGGAINYIANTADAGGFDAAVETGLSQTRNANMSYSLKGMVNIPIKEDVLAVRAVAQYRSDAGYLDNVGTGLEGSNDVEVSGGRFSAVLTPNESTKVSWLSLVQKIETDDASYRMPAFGDLVRSTAILEPMETEIEVHSLRLDQDLGWGSFTALASHQVKTQSVRSDFTAYRGWYDNNVIGVAPDGAYYISAGGESTGNSIELRLASASGDRFEWLVGAMYFDTDKQLYETLGAVGARAAFDASPLYPAGAGAIITPDGEIFNSFLAHVTGEEKAVFGEASFHFNPEWTLTAGGRMFRTRVKDVGTIVGVDSYPGAPIITPTSTSESGFNPKVSLTWKPNERWMGYVLASEGFRFGTPNNTAITTHPIPSGSSSDQLRNYELGLRSSWLDNTLVLDATAFYIDWTDIQLRLLTPAPEINYASNGGAAYSRGIEFSAQWRPSQHFDWTSSITWQQARLDEDVLIPGVGIAPSGSRMPGSADWSVNNMASWHFDGAWQPTFSLSHSYLSEGISDLNSAVPSYAANRQGDYHLVDARLRFSVGQADIGLYATNLFDERGITRAQPQANGLGQGIVRPRTYGVTLRWNY